jgi:hypothetical protein
MKTQQKVRGHTSKKSSLLHKLNALKKIQKIEHGNKMQHEETNGISESIEEHYEANEAVERIFYGDDKAREKLNKQLQTYFKKISKKKSEKKSTKNDSESDSSDSDESDDDEVTTDLLKMLSHHTIAYGVFLSNLLTNETQIGSSPFMRYLYYKRYRGVLPIQKEDGSNETQELMKKRARETTLQVFNLPADVDENLISQFFESRFGKVDTVTRISLEKETKSKCYMLKDPFADAPREYKDTLTSAFVTFNETKSLLASLIAPELATRGELKRQDLHIEAVSGLQQYANAHSTGVKDVKAAQSRLNALIREYDKKVKRDIQLVDALRNRPDEDGWIKVVAPKGRKYKGLLTESDMKKRRDAISKKKVPTKTRLQEEMPFYKFQRIAKQKHSVQTLRDKFEEDKKLIERMKKENKFSIGL